MSYLIDRSKGRDHIYSELCRIRDEVGIDKMDMMQKIKLHTMELEEMKRKQEFDAAVERAVAARMNKSTELPQPGTEETTETVITD